MEKRLQGLAARAAAVLLLITPSLACADDPAPSPKVLAALKVVFDAMDAAARDDAALPPPKSDSERLIRLGVLDQAGRVQIFKIPWASLSPAEGLAARKALAAKMDPIDRDDLAQVVSMIPPDGWFSYSRYGRAAADAAFDIVQHGDSQTQRRVLPMIEAFAEHGEADPDNFAKMYDRLAIETGPQRFGTQFHCVNGFTAPYPVVDPAAVETRRTALGLKPSFAEMSAGVAHIACR